MNIVFSPLVVFDRIDFRKAVARLLKSPIVLFCTKAVLLLFDLFFKALHSVCCSFQADSMKWHEIMPT